jgi:predicted HD phosphohydrolase
MQHGLQAATLAEAAGKKPTFIAACLLHDVGHLLGLEYEWPAMGNLGVADHEQKGALWLRERGFPLEMCTLVEHHITPKRYRLTVDPAYRAKLSAASLGTFVYQGGLMSVAEVQAFEKHPWFLEFLEFRQMDDGAKEVEQSAASSTKTWADFLPYLDLCLYENNKK